MRTHSKREKREGEKMKAREEKTGYRGIGGNWAAGVRTIDEDEVVWNKNA